MFAKALSLTLAGGEYDKGDEGSLLLLLSYGLLLLLLFLSCCLCDNRIYCFIKFCASGQTHERIVRWQLFVYVGVYLYLDMCTYVSVCNRLWSACARVCDISFPTF